MDEEALQLVRRFLPGQPARTITPLGAGLDNVAYLVDDDLVVRRNADPRAVEREAELLRTVAAIVPVPVPQPLFATAGWLCYRKLAGIPLLDLPADRRPAFGAVLGELLSALHTADPPAEVDDTEPATELAFSHNDLGAEHVLVDPASGAVTGVIDWTDAAITDPAYDFGLLLRDLGPDGLSAALTAYGRPVDERRILFYAICKALEDLDYGVDRYRDNALAALDRLL